MQILWNWRSNNETGKEQGGKKENRNGTLPRAGIRTQRVSDYFRNSVCIGGSMFVYTLSVNLFCYQGTDFGVSGYACSRYACHFDVRLVCPGRHCWKCGTLFLCSDVFPSGSFWNIVWTEIKLCGSYHCNPVRISPDHRKRPYEENYGREHRKYRKIYRPSIPGFCCISCGSAYFSHNSFGCWLALWCCLSSWNCAGLCHSIFRIQWGGQREDAPFSVCPGRYE